MDLNSISVQIVKGSFFAYIPKVWAKEMKLKKGDKLTWYIDEKDHTTIKLRKEEETIIKHINGVG